MRTRSARALLWALVLFALVGVVATQGTQRYGYGSGRQLQDAGAQLLTLHGRTREQGFKGAADWSAITKVREALIIPLIANGDINTPEDALCCLDQTGAAGVMVGRGTMGAPWLVGQIDAALKGRTIPETPNPTARVELARDQLADLVQDRGDHGMLIARKHMGWTCTGFPGASQLRRDLMRATTPAQAKNLLNQQIDALASSA